MKRTLIILAGIFLLLEASGQNASDTSLFNMAMASRLARMPLHCIPNEWPNKTSHLSDTVTDHILLPHQLHPSFFGCLDWHSSVHGHWMLVKLLKTFPDMPDHDKIMALLENSFQADKMLAESEYFSKYPAANTYERTYGWAWLLKLDEEIYRWNNPRAKQWHENLKPLTNKIVELWMSYLPKQTYPNRTGVHPNTAFGLVFALDWANAMGNIPFANMIKKRSRDYFLSNKKTPAYLEPDGTDFLSPSLEIADLMRRVLPRTEFLNWFNSFFTSEGIANLVRQPVVSDRTDYLIVHLDGLSLSRAWCMKGIASDLPNGHPYKKLFLRNSNAFIKSTLPHIDSGNYVGDHWLATFAVYAIFG
ncbi:MAG: DUF2891 domain-containing protein [Chitinophagales bacterium]